MIPTDGGINPKENNMDRITAQSKDMRITADPERMKTIAIAITEHIESTGVEDKVLRDFVFSMELTYQNYHGLDQDDWGRKE